MEGVDQALPDGNEIPPQQQIPPQPQWDPSYLPSSFSGAPHEDFDSWFRKLQIVLTSYPNGAPTVLQALPSRLEGKAFAYWDQLPQAHKNNLERTQQAMRNVFGQTSQIQRTRDFTPSRKRLENEPIEMYAASVREIVNTAFVGEYDYGDQFRDREMMRRFIQGLDPQLQIKCREHGPINLGQAIVIARRVESAVKAAQSQQPEFKADTVNVIGPCQSVLQAPEKSSSASINSLMAQMTLINDRLDTISNTNAKLNCGIGSVNEISSDVSYPYSKSSHRSRSPARSFHSTNRFRSPNRSFRSPNRFHSHSPSRFRNDHYDRQRSPSPYYHRDRSHGSSHGSSHDTHYPRHKSRTPPPFHRNESPYRRRDSSPHVTFSDKHDKDRSPSPRYRRESSSHSRDYSSPHYKSRSSSPYRYDYDSRHTENRSDFESGNDSWSPRRTTRRPYWNQ